VFKEKVQKLDLEMEKVKLELIAKNDVTVGILEKIKESHEDLERSKLRTCSELTPLQQQRETKL
jgi:hypothetical protein